MKDSIDRLDYNHYIEQNRRHNGYKSHAVSTDYIITSVDKIKDLRVTCQATTSINVTITGGAAYHDRVLRVTKMDSTAGDVVLVGTVNAVTTNVITTQYTYMKLKYDNNNSTWLNIT